MAVVDFCWNNGGAEAMAPKMLVLVLLVACCWDGVVLKVGNGTGDDWVCCA